MTHPVDTHVGARIRQRRFELGWSLMHLAGQVGIKYQQIQKYETGENRISAGRLWDVAKAMHVPVASFFDGLGETSPVDDKPSAHLAYMIQSLPDAQRRIFFELARELNPEGI